jgi:hypothetical protein
LIAGLLFDNLILRVGEREDGKSGCTRSPLLKGDTFNDSGNVVLRRFWYGAGDEIHSRRPCYGGSCRLGPDWFHRHSCQVGRSHHTREFGDGRGCVRARLFHRMLFREALRPPPAEDTVDATLPGLVEHRDAVALARADLRARVRSLKGSDFDSRQNEDCPTRVSYSFVSAV